MSTGARPDFLPEVVHRRGPAATEPVHSTGSRDPNHTEIPQQPAAALFQIAHLVEAGFPMPEHVTVVGDEVVAFVSADDLPRWVIELDMPAPDWVFTDGGEVLYRRAVWPDHTFAAAGLMFRIACGDTVPVVEDVTP